VSAPRILFLADEFLHPKNRGGRVETANEVELISEVLGFPLHLLVPRDPWTTPDDEAAHRRALAVPTTFFDRPPRRRATITRPLLPYIAATRWPVAAETNAVVATITAQGPIDVILAAHDFMWPFARVLASRLGDVPVVIRSHNDEPRYFAGMRAASPTRALRAFYIRETILSKRLRSLVGRNADRIAVLALDDAAGYRSPHTELVPPLVYDGSLTQDPPRPSVEGRDQLLFVGALDATLSLEGIQWFRRYVLPALARQRPGTRLRIVGRGASESVAAELRSDPLVEYVGPVADLDPEFAAARVFVNPVLNGSGVNMKMGGPARRGIPIVTNELGARGFDALRPGLSLADDAGSFARACKQLLDDDDTWESKATALWAAFSDHYSVAAAATAFDGLLRGVAQR
jgi:glycosyltransferase involved in cell wall biosynthesis